MKKIILTCLIIMSVSGMRAQQAFFADGFHGGVYGHYPLTWYTGYILQQLSKYPQWQINMEIEPETWDSVRIAEPDAYLDFRKAATGNRIEFVNPTYAQPYLYNISGESIIRQFQYGMKKLENHFPGITFTTYSSEEPCFTSCLPGIISGFGMKYIVLKCPDTCWGGYTGAYGGTFVNLIGPDGSTVTAVPRYACEELLDGSTWQTTAWNNSKQYIKACTDSGIDIPAGMCYQDAGWRHGPWLGGDRTNDSNSRYIRWCDYFDEYAPKTAKQDWRFSQEDIRGGLMWATEVLNDITQKVRHAENRMSVAEKTASMASIVYGTPYPKDALDRAWRTLLLSQHHDCWIVPYNLNKKGTWADEVNDWTRQTTDIADSIISTSITRNDNTDMIRVYNTLGHTRKEVVSIPLSADLADGRFTLVDAYGKTIEYTFGNDNGQAVIRFCAEVPAFGYSSYRILKAKLSHSKSLALGSSKTSFRKVIVNLYDYQLVIDTEKGGVISSLLDKRTGIEYAPSDSRFAMDELRGFFRKENRFVSSTETPAKVTMIEDNAMMKRVLIEGSIAGYPFHKTITMREGERRIDFDLTIDWQKGVSIGDDIKGNIKTDRYKSFYDTRHYLNVMFPTRFSQDSLYKDAPFDVCKSRNDNTFFSTWDSIKHNVILHWADIESHDGKGLAVFTDHTTSYSSGRDYPLSLSVAYSGPGLWGRDYPITHSQNIKYSILPHSDRWDKAGVQKCNANANEPLVAGRGHFDKCDSRSIIDLDGSGYELSSVVADNDGITMRIYNADGNDNTKRLTINIPITSIAETNLRGNVTGDVNTSSANGTTTITTAIPRFGIKTFKIRTK